MEGSVFRRCGCRDPRTGRKLEKACPKLKRRDHGSYWARYDEPVRPGAKRRQRRIGPFPTKEIAESELREALGRIDAGTYAPTDRGLTVEADLTRWLHGRVSLKASTRRCNQELADLYLIPGLGHLRVQDLQEHHIETLYAAMRQIGRDTDRPPSDMLRRLLSARTNTPQAHRPLGRSRIRRTHAVLHAYLNAAVRRGTITRNPASNVELEAGRQKRALVWTPARLQRWEQTGRRPARSMVWTPEQAGAFLDHAATDRLYPLFHLVAYRGLRRGEALGLAWADADLDTATLTIRENLVDTDDLDDSYEEFDDPKTPAGDRTIGLDQQTTTVLRIWKRRQQQERAAAGADWVDSGRMFTKPNGEPLEPNTVSQHFDRLLDRAARPELTCTAITRAGTQCARQATVELDGQARCGLRRHGGHNGKPLPRPHNGLPPIRFHDLRHTAASLTYRATRDLKLVSELLGHSSTKITADIYTHVFADVDRAAAEAVAQLVPRAVTLDDPGL